MIQIQQNEAQAPAGAGHCVGPVHGHQPENRDVLDDIDGNARGDLPHLCVCVANGATVTRAKKEGTKGMGMGGMERNDLPLVSGTGTSGRLSNNII